MVVLFVEKPLVAFGAVKRIGWQIRAAFGEMQQDRVRLGQEPPVVERDGRDLSHRILGEIFGLPRRAVARGDFDRPERALEVGEQQPHLVAIS